MTETKKKALALVNEIERQEGLSDLTPRIMRGLVMDEALCRVIEQHEAFRQEVSDAVEAAKRTYGGHRQAFDQLDRFIVPKPDPLVEALKQLKMSYVDAEDFRAALAARGLEIREKARV